MQSLIARKNSLYTPFALLSLEANELMGRNRDFSPELGDLLRGQGLSGYVYSRGLKHPSLKEDWLAQSAHNLLALNELKKLGIRCAAIHIAPGLLKGFALVDDVYADLGMRFTSDIDLYVLAKDRPSVEKILENLGYSPLFEARWRANHYKSNWQRQISPGVHVEIELHTQVFASDERVSWHWLPASLQNFTKLAPADMLVHLLGHLGHQHTFSRLFWLVDLDNVVRRFPQLDWDRVFLLASNLRHSASASAGLWACQTFLGTPVPECELRRYGSTWRWRALIHDAFLFYPQRHRLRYYILKHILQESLCASLSYDWRWLWRNR